MATIKNKNELEEMGFTIVTYENQDGIPVFLEKVIGMTDSFYEYICSSKGYSREEVDGLKINIAIGLNVPVNQWCVVYNPDEYSDVIFEVFSNKTQQDIDAFVADCVKLFGVNIAC